MDVNQSKNFLDLPSEILEKIVDHLPFLAVRKNLRLTCRKLNNLCNLEHFCRDEWIAWCNCVRCRRQILADFSKSSRGGYNLIFKSMRVKSRDVSPFFQQFGAKVRFLRFQKISSSPDLLETITSYCGGLVSLMCDSSFGSSDPKFVPLPSVTSLVLHLEYIVAHRSIRIPSLFHEMPSIFPCVKHLKITLRVEDSEKWYAYSRSKGCIWKLASNFHHLESLNLHMSMNELVAEVPQFPKLKDLRIHLDGDCWIFSGPLKDKKFSDLVRSSWPGFIYRFIGVNTFSIKISGIKDLRLSDIMPSLTGIGLERLWLSYSRTHFNIEDFEALVSSHLKIMCFDAETIAPWTEYVTKDWALETNKTLTDLKFGHSFSSERPQDCLSLVMLFCTYFHGLVHLETHVVNDAILQTIFKYQRNLRSLVLDNSVKCSIKGFCGGEDSPYENTIANLQKLEQLQIGVDAEVIQSDHFQAAFRFPVLRYLKMWTSSRDKDKREFRFTYVDFNQFYWIDSAKLLSDCVPGSFYYDQTLDRTVFTSQSGYNIQIHTPKISSKTVDWITVGAGDE